MRALGRAAGQARPGERRRNPLSSYQYPIPYTYWQRWICYLLKFVIYLSNLLYTTITFMDLL